MSKKRKSYEKPTHRPPVTVDETTWLFAVAIRNQAVFDEAVMMLKDSHFGDNELWLALVWNIVRGLHKDSDGKLPSRKLILTRCKADLKLNPDAINPGDTQKINKLLEVAFSLAEEDMDTQVALDAMRRFLEDRLVSQASESLSLPQTPSSLESEFLKLADEAKSIRALGGGSLLPLDLKIVCHPPDKSDRRRFVATLGDRSHEHHFNVHDQNQRRPFCEQAATKLGIAEPSCEEFEKRIIAAASTGTTELFTPNVINMATVEVKPISWLWCPYIPTGAITVLEGDPGDGKSLVALDIAARLSRSDAMPPQAVDTGELPPGITLIISGEDDPERTIKPRLLAAEACDQRIHLLRGVTIPNENERFVQLPIDIPIIERIVLGHCVRLVIIDVLSTVTEDGKSLNDDADMRRLLTPLATMAQRTNVAILIIRHFNKKAGINAMYRGTGSVAITAAARSVLALAPHPQDPDLRVLVGIKNNLGPRPASLTYRIEPVDDVARIVWDGETELTAADVLQQSGTRATKLEQAQALIRALLAGGPRCESEVRTACQEAGIGETTYRRARRALGVQAERAGFGTAGEWMLHLNGAGTAPSAQS